MNALMANEHAMLHWEQVDPHRGEPSQPVLSASGQSHCKIHSFLTNLHMKTIQEKAQSLLRSLYGKPMQSNQQGQAAYNTPPALPNMCALILNDRFVP